jgi:hypothetical protein
VTTIRDEFQKATNPFRKPIDDRWGQYLSNDDRRKIARYLADNKDIIESYLGPIDRKNMDKVDKILKYIETYSIYRQLQSQQPQPQQHHIDKYSVFEYIKALKDLDEIVRHIKEGYLSFLPQDPNAAKPGTDYLEIVFGINENPKKQKETLIEILKRAIGKIMVRGYPAFYYDPSKYNNTDLPLIYYVQLNDNSFFPRFFIHKMKLPPKTTGYLLHELSNIIQSRRKSLIFPSGNQYHIIKDYLGRDLAAIDQDPNTDPYILQSLRSFYEHQEFT